MRFLNLFLCTANYYKKNNKNDIDECQLTELRNLVTVSMFKETMTDLIAGFIDKNNSYDDIPLRVYIVNNENTEELEHWFVVAIGLFKKTNLNRPPSPIAVTPKRLQLSNSCGRARVFDFFGSKESLEIGQLLRELDFEVKSTIKTTQVGPSCGYIASAISSKLALYEASWFNIDVGDCCTSQNTNLVKFCNDYLGYGPTAIFLKSRQCELLTEYLYKSTLEEDMTESQQQRFLNTKPFDGFIKRLIEIIGKFDKGDARFYSKYVTTDNKFPLYVTTVNTHNTGKPGHHWFVVAFELYLKNPNDS